MATCSQSPGGVHGNTLFSNLSQLTAHLYLSLPIFPSTPPPLGRRPFHVRIQHEKQRDRKDSFYIDLRASASGARARSPGSFVRGMFGRQQTARFVMVAWYNTCFGSWRGNRRYRPLGVWLTLAATNLRYK